MKVSVSFRSVELFLCGIYLEYIAGLRAVAVYKWAWVALVFVGATVPLKLVWNLSDAFNGLMAIPNLIALVALSPMIFTMLKAYESAASTEASVDAVTEAE